MVEGLTGLPVLFKKTGLLF